MKLPGQNCRDAEKADNPEESEKSEKSEMADNPATEAGNRMAGRITHG